jgi:hypothetical protein
MKLESAIPRAVLAMALIVIGALSTAPVSAQDGIHHLALQISDSDPQKMNTVLNVASNVSRHYSELGEEVEIQIVAFNQGLHMLRTDTAPDNVKKRVEGFAMSMPNVSFVACGNTITGMTKKEGKAPPIVAHAKTVPAGVVTLIELDEKGWTIVRP